jgi:hypothetical protein
VNKIHPRHLSPEELAERWSVSARHLANWRVVGKGPRFVKTSYHGVLYPVGHVRLFEKFNPDYKNR